MTAVPVSGFHDHIIRMVQIFRILYQWLTGVSDISGKYDLFLRFFFSDRHFNTGRSKQMSCINKTYRNSFCRSNHLIIRASYKISDHTHCVFHCVCRHKFRFALSSALAVSPLSFKHLNMSTVSKHNITQMTGGVRCVYWPSKSFCINSRKISGMIHMRMGKKNKLNFSHSNWYLCILIIVRSLFHTAVYKKFMACCLQIIA